MSRCGPGLNHFDEGSTWKLRTAKYNGKCVTDTRHKAAQRQQSVRHRGASNNENIFYSAFLEALELSRCNTRMLWYAFLKMENTKT